MAATSSESTVDKESSSHSMEIYYSNDGKSFLISLSYTFICFNFAKDIRIIHDIVVLAQQLLPTLGEDERFPTTALFAAYYDILPRNGISTAGETKFARLLFKIGGQRGPGTLFEKFEETLARMGIDVEFTKAGSSENSGSIVDGSHNSELFDSMVADHSTSNQRRRNSESSKWDYNIGHELQIPTRRNSLSVEPAQPYYAFYQHDLKLLDVKASLIRQRMLRGLAYRCCRQWKRRALELREDNLGLQTLAIHRDRRILLQGALGDWRSKLQATQDVRENDRALIALARRHLIRRRVFLFWKSLATVNKTDKMQYLSKKFFSIWRQRISQRAQQNKVAEAFYEHRLKKSLFGAKGVNGAQRKVKGVLPSSHVHKFSSKNVPLCTTEQPGRHCEDGLHIEGKISTTSPVDIWRWRTHQVAQATHLDQAKIIREAWVNWQHALRANTLQLRSNLMSVSDCLYRMVLTVRVIAFTRKISERIKREVFENWMFQTQNIKVRARAQKLKAKTHFKQRRKSDCLNTLTLNFQNHRRSVQLASNFRVSRILQTQTSRWKTEGQHLKRLENWSHDASYFFLVSKCLNRWIAAARTSKREKRKIAYAQVRRISKMNVARIVLRDWQQRSQQQSILDGQARQVLYNKTVTLAMDLLDRWRERSQEISEMNISALRAQRLNAVNLWRAQAVSVNRMHHDAELHFAEKRGTGALRKWSREALKLQSRSKYALDIYEKNSKRSFRRRFTQWQQKPTYWREAMLSDLSKQIKSDSMIRAGSRSMDFSMSRRAYGSVDLPDTLEIPQRPGARLLRSGMNMQSRFSGSTIKGSYASKSVDMEDERIQNHTKEVQEVPQGLFASGIERVSLRGHQNPQQVMQQPLLRVPGFAEQNNPAKDDFDFDNADTANRNEHWVPSIEKPPDTGVISSILDTPSKRVVPLSISTTPAAVLSTPTERRLRAQYSGGPLQPFRGAKFNTSLKRDIITRDMTDEGS